MPKGTVKFYNEKSKFGFIKMEENGQEIYVGSTGLLEPIKNDDHVEFDIQDAKKGPVAINVKVVKS
jgi:CspA family cold shock protein